VPRIGVVPGTSDDGRDAEPDPRRLTREDVGSWLSGPGAVLPPTQDYRGQRLGLPGEGPGAIGGWGRRLGALVIDWVACLLIVRLAFPGVEYGTNASGFLTLAMFFVELTLLTWLTGSSLGQRLVGLTVVRLGGGAPGLGRALLRSLMVCLLVPPLIWDRDSRGVHDRALGLVLVRR